MASNYLFRQLNLKILRQLKETSNVSLLSNKNEYNNIIAEGVMYKMK